MPKRFADFDACLCFEAGERTQGGRGGGDREAQGGGDAARPGSRALRRTPGSAPEKGRSALLALAAVAQLVAARSDPAGPDRLTAVPTILRSGDAFNVVPAAGELVCDLRADRLEAFDPVLDAIPTSTTRSGSSRRMVRAWPGMDSRAATAAVLAAASERLGRPIVASERGGASDASHMAAGGIELTIDGLGPRGGGAHAPHEWVSAESLRTRAEVALAVTAALLRRLGGDFGGRSALLRSPSAPGSAWRDLMSSLR